MQRIDAFYFDGNSTQSQSVKLTLNASGTITVQLKDKALQITPSQRWLNQHISGMPYQFNIQSGGAIEIPFSTEAAAWVTEAFSLSSGGIPEKLESSFFRTFYASILTFIILILFFIYLLPAIAKIAFPYIPTSIKERVANSTFDSLERFVFKPSTLAKEKQEKYKALLTQLLQVTKFQMEIRLIFRNTQNEVANAFALLPNTIICTDQLINLLTTAEYQAVLAHEIGHLKLDHGTQQLINQITLQILSKLFLGSDGANSSIVQALIKFLLPNAYSRDQEREADLFAIQHLKQLNIDPNNLVTALEKLERSYDNKQQAQSFITNMLGKLLSSHPSTKERRDTLSAN
jgi:Zn-dependent protease with chaperone function